MSNAYKLTFALLLGMMFATLFILMQKPWQVSGSVAVSNGYESTTTPQVADLLNLCPQRNNAASSTTGILGSVNVLTNGNGGYLAIFDATTSNATLRDTATSSLNILAWFPVNATSSSYHFDVKFNKGLLVDYTTGVATTTISYRCGE